MRRALRIFGAASSALVALVAVAFPAGASAAFPGGNGRILFYSNVPAGPSLHTMNPDGGDNHQIYPLPGYGFLFMKATWSPDGTKIALGDSDIWTLDPSGGSQTVVLGGETSDRYPSWSPDGAQIVFERAVGPNATKQGIPYVMGADGSDPRPLLATPPCTRTLNYCNPRPVWSATGRIALVSDRSGASDLWSMNADGSDPIRLASAPGDYQDWDWSPDGRRLAFTQLQPSSDPLVPPMIELSVVDADGTHLQHVMSLGPRSVPSNGVAWSPNGTRIAAGRTVTVGNYYFTDIVSMNPDGSDLRQVTTDGASYHPDWQPLVASAPPPGSVGAPPRLAISRRVVRLSRNGAAAVRVSCAVPGVGGVCAGTLKLASARPVACGRSHRKRLLLGLRAFRINRGHTGAVKVRISAAGRRLLACRPKLRVRATATVARPSGGALTFRSSFDLLPTKAKSPGRSSGA